MPKWEYGWMRSGLIAVDGFYPDSYKPKADFYVLFNEKQLIQNDKQEIDSIGICNTILPLLNRLGKENWELVSYTAHIESNYYMEWVFKRPLEL